MKSHKGKNLQRDKKVYEKNLVERYFPLIPLFANILVDHFHDLLCSLSHQIIPHTIQHNFSE